MTGTGKTYTGQDAAIWISGQTHTTLAISDFSITFDAGVVEQELVGEIGNYRVAGAVGCELSLTHCKLDANVAPHLLTAVIRGNDVKISGNSGPNSLHFYLVSCAVGGFDISMGDADTITEGSVDFTVRTPYQLVRKWIPGGDGVLVTNA